MTTQLDQAQESPTAANAGLLDGHRLLKGRQAAEVLAISPRTLWSLSASGEIPTVRFRNCVRYSSSDLRTWIAKHRLPRR